MASSSSSSSSSEPHGDEILVRFVTSVPSLRVPAAPIAIPSRSTRSDLCRVIASLLGRGESFWPISLALGRPRLSANLAWRSFFQLWWMAGEQLRVQNEMHFPCACR